MISVTLPEKARYTFGGDEFLFVEVDETMSLAANIRATTIARGLQQQQLAGLTEICPANASLLLRVNPEVLDPRELKEIVEDLEAQAQRSSGEVIETRIVEVPVWYADPFTTEACWKYREGYHQDPSGTDLEYAAKINGLSSVEEVVQRHHEQPWLVTMVGFVAGLPFLFQLVEQDQQIEVPKYLSPRPGGTPKLTIGHGGCFGSFYSVEGAGGYQMMGIGVGPIYDPEQNAADLQDSRVFFNPGDIVKYRPIEEAQYYQLRKEVEAGTFRYKQVPVQFDAQAALTRGEAYSQTLLEALNGN